MRILVTGGAGFIGTNLIKNLLKLDCEVYSIDNYSTGKKENEQEGCVYHDVDIRDAVDFDFFMEKPDVIYHLAALPRIQPSFDYPAVTFESNVLSTLNLLDWINSQGHEKTIPLIYAGSSSFHGGVYKNPYTFSKWQGEELVKMYNKIYDIPTAICRFYNVYGPHQLTEGEYCTVIGVFETQYKNKEELTITGDGEQRRDFTHIDDIVEGLILTSESNDFDLDIVELGRGENHSINELAEMFEWGYTYIPERPGEAKVTLCDTSIAKKDIGYEPKVNLKDYIKEVISE